MPSSLRSITIEEILGSLDVPDTAYILAEKRYTDLGKWLCNRGKAASASYNPHIYPQGSFRLGTVTKPWKHEEFDLDLACIMQDSLSKKQISQKKLKSVVGHDLDEYRKERGIQEQPEPKHRCWRLTYQDDLPFHLDIVPGLPEDDDRKNLFYENMIKAGTAEVLAQDVVEHLIAITDDQHPDFKKISLNWHISNQEGYAIWFKSRMRLAKELLEARAEFEKVASVDDLPIYKWKNPLQHSVQILKRHRDVMFENNSDEKPISIIITTLAARAYRGESDIESALRTIINTMSSYINDTGYRVPNPVNSKEDFADKWPTNSNLEMNFRSWLAQVKKDFDFLGTSNDALVLKEAAQRNFGTSLDASLMQKKANLLEKAVFISSGLAHTKADGRIDSSGGTKNPLHKFYG